MTKVDDVTLVTRLAATFLRVTKKVAGLGTRLASRYFQKALQSFALELATTYLVTSLFITSPY